MAAGVRLPADDWGTEEPQPQGADAADVGHFSGRFEGKSLRLHQGDTLAVRAEAAGAEYDEDSENAEEEEAWMRQQEALRRQEREQRQQEMQRKRVELQQQQQQQLQATAAAAATTAAALAAEAAALQQRPPPPQQQQWHTTTAASGSGSGSGSARSLARARDHVRTQWHTLLGRVETKCQYKHRLLLACEHVPEDCRLDLKDAKCMTKAELLEALKSMEFAAEHLHAIVLFVQQSESERAENLYKLAQEQAENTQLLAAALTRQPELQRDILQIATMTPNGCATVSATIYRYLTVPAYHSLTVHMTPPPQLWSAKEPPLLRWEFNDAIRLIQNQVNAKLYKVLDGFLDMSKNHGHSMLWEHVIVLEPLHQQQADGRGFIRFRTNARFVRKLRNRTLLLLIRCLTLMHVTNCDWAGSAGLCMLEALLFATGSTLSQLNCLGMQPVNGHGLAVRHVQNRLQGKTPFELQMFDLGELSVFGLIQLVDGIYLASASITIEAHTVPIAHAMPSDTHSMVWDAWRSLLFIGPGNFDDKQTDGCISVSREDIANRHAVSPVKIGIEQAPQELTLTEYVSAIFGVQSVYQAALLKVHKKRVRLTAHI